MHTCRFYFWTIAALYLLHRLVQSVCAHLNSLEFRMEWNGMYGAVSVCTVHTILNFNMRMPMHAIDVARFLSASVQSPIHNIHC